MRAFAIISRCALFVLRSGMAALKDCIRWRLFASKTRQKNEEDHGDSPRFVSCDYGSMTE